MKRRNNKGFTLTEVLIASAILTVAIMPLAANFVQSSKVNQKSKRTMDATYMAQDIMEGVSAYSAEELIKMFESDQDLMGRILPNNITTYASHGDADGTDSDFPAVYSVTRGAGAGGDVVGVRQYSNAVLSGNTIDVKKSADGNYYFFVKGIQQEKNEYNIRLTLSSTKAAGYKDGDPKGGLKELAAKDPNAEVNGKDMPYIVNIEAPYDVAIKNTVAVVEGMASQFQAKSTNPSKFGGSNAWVDNITRKCKIHIKSDYSVELVNQYGVIPSKRAEYGFDASTVDDTNPNISEMGSSAIPRSIYIFMEGMPSATLSQENDQVEIVNDLGEETTVYIIRTISAVNGFSNPDSTKTMAALEGLVASSGNVTYNTNYKSKVSVIDPASKTKVVTNLKFNLNKLYDITKKDVDQDEFSNARCIYMYNGTEITNGNDLMMNGFSTKPQDYIYTAFLEIYDAKQNKVLATIDGGIEY